MKRKMALIISLMLLVILPAVSVQAAAPTPTTTITIWLGQLLPGGQQMFEKYEASHPGLTIELVTWPFITGDMNYDLWTTITEGTGPDIVGTANDNIGILSLFDLIVDLNQFDFKNNWLSNIYNPIAVKGVQLGGQIWALPSTTEGIALVYNKALVTPEYLPVDPLDFTALRDKAAAFLADTGMPLICNQAFQGDPYQADAYHVAPVFFGFGVPSYVDETGTVYLDTPEALAAGNWIRSMHDLSPENASYNNCESAFLSGEVGMWWTGPWALYNLNVSGIDYGIVPMGRPFVGIQTFMITPNAVDRGNAQLAVDIIKFMTNTSSAKSMTLVDETIPANSAALKIPAVQALPAVKGFSAAISNGVPMSPSIYSSCQWGPVGEAVIAIWNDTMPVADALAIAQQQIEACISGSQ